MGAVQDFLINYYRRRPGVIVLYLLFGLYGPIRAVVVPQYFAALISLVEAPTLAWPKIRRAAYWVAGLWTVSIVLQTASGMLDARVAPCYKREYRQFLLGEIMRRHQHHYRAVATGDATVKLYESPYATFRLVQIMRTAIIPLSLTMLAALYFYYKASSLMGTGFLVVLGLLVATAFAIVGVMTPAYGKTAQALDTVHEWIEDVLRNLQAVLLTDQMEEELENHHAKTEEHFAAVQIEARQEVWLSTAALVCRYVFVGLTLVIALYLRSTRAILTIAPLILVTTTINGDIEAFLRTLVFWSYYLADIKKLESYLDSLPGTGCARSGCAPAARDAAIRFGNATIAYGNRVVFPALTFAVNAGQKVVLTGGIGCGKSSLARVLTGTLPYCAGTVTIGGCNVSDMSSADLAGTVAYVPQNPRLFDRTLLENLLYGLPGKTERDVTALLERLQIPDFPTDRSIRVGKDGAELSGGQRAVCYLLRAVLRDVQIVILDEPTAAMDGVSAESFFRVASTMLAGRTVIVITHDTAEEARWASVGAQKYTVRQGTVVAGE